MTQQQPAQKPYDLADTDRLARKIALLLEKHPGKDLLAILKETTAIKDEFVALLDLPNHKLEYHIDKSLSSC